MKHLFLLAVFLLAFIWMAATTNLIGTFILALRTPANPKRVVWLTFMGAAAFAGLIVLALAYSMPGDRPGPPPSKVKTLQT